MPYVAKDENHVRIVGVTGYPPTPNVSDASNLHLIPDPTTGSSLVATPSSSNGVPTADIIKPLSNERKSSKKQNFGYDNQVATSSKTNGERSKSTVTNGVKFSKPGASSSVDGRNGDAHFSESGNKPVKEKFKDKIADGLNGVGGGSSSLASSHKVNSGNESSTSKNRDQEKSGRANSNGNSNNEINNRPLNVSADRIDKHRDKHKAVDEYKKRDNNRHSNDYVNHNHHHRYSSDDDVSKSRRSPSSARANSTYSGTDSKRDNKEQRTSDDEKKCKDIRRDISDGSNKKVSPSPKDRQHKGKNDNSTNKNRPSLKLPGKSDEDERLNVEVGFKIELRFRLFQREYFYFFESKQKLIIFILIFLYEIALVILPRFYKINF